MSSGIDYGRGMSNIDKETGIRYGVISIRTPMPEALQDIYDAALDANYDAAQAALREYIRNRVLDIFTELRGNAINGIVDSIVESIIDADGLSEIECAGGDYIKYGYHIHVCETTLMILKSPYVTRGRFCSPCYPGAIDLDTPDADGELAYCLGADFFENDKAPYPVLSPCGDCGVPLDATDESETESGKCASCRRNEFRR